MKGINQIVKCKWEKSKFKVSSQKNLPSLPDYIIFEILQEF